MVDSGASAPPFLFGKRRTGVTGYGLPAVVNRSPLLAFGGPGCDPFGFGCGQNGTLPVRPDRSILSDNECMSFASWPAGCLPAGPFCLRCSLPVPGCRLAVDDSLPPYPPSRGLPGDQDPKQWSSPPGRRGMGAKPCCWYQVRDGRLGDQQRAVSDQDPAVSELSD